MKKATKIIIAITTLLVLLLTLTSCSQVKNLTGESYQELATPAPTQPDTQGKESLSEDQSAAKSGQTSPPTEPGSTATNQDNAKTDRLIIRQESLTMQVDNVRTAYKKVDQIAGKYNGHIVNASISSSGYGQSYVPSLPGTTEEQTPPIQQDYSSRQNGDDSGPLYATIVLKVAGEQTSAALKDIKKLGKVESEQESEEEVTEQYVDLNARLKNLQRTEQRYLEFFNAAKNVDDMLKVEEQLTRVRGEIESLQAQIDYLQKSAQMGTITLYLHEPTQVTKPIRDWGFVQALLQAIQNFITVVNYFVMAFGALLPLIILIIVLILIIRWAVRRKRTTS